MRILNEKKVDDKELRALIVEMRDRDYDTMQENGKIPAGIDNGTEKMVYQGAMMASSLVLRLSKSI